MDKPNPKDLPDQSDLRKLYGDEPVEYPKKVDWKNPEHKPDCVWMNSNCEYKETHKYCPHPEHFCDCHKKNISTKQQFIEKSLKELEDSMPDIMVTTQVEPRLLNEDKVKKFLQSKLSECWDMAGEEHKDSVKMMGYVDENDIVRRLDQKAINKIVKMVTNSFVPKQVK